MSTTNYLLYIKDLALPQIRTILERHDELVIELRVEAREPCIESRGPCHIARPCGVVGSALQFASEAGLGLPCSGVMGIYVALHNRRAYIIVKGDY